MSCCGRRCRPPLVPPPLNRTLTAHTQTGTRLLDGECELQLNPSCLRYLGSLHASLLGDAAARLRGGDAEHGRGAAGVGPLRQREIVALLRFLALVPLLKLVPNRRGELVSFVFVGFRFRCACALLMVKVRMNVEMFLHCQIGLICFDLMFFF